MYLFEGCSWRVAGEPAQLKDSKSNWTLRRVKVERVNYLLWVGNTTFLLIAISNKEYSNLRRYFAIKLSPFSVTILVHKIVKHPASLPYRTSVVIRSPITIISLDLHLNFSLNISPPKGFFTSCTNILAPINTIA